MRWAESTAAAGAWHDAHVQVRRCVRSGVFGDIYAYDARTLVVIGDDDDDDVAVVVGKPKGRRSAVNQSITICMPDQRARTHRHHLCASARRVPVRPPCATFGSPARTHPNVHRIEPRRIHQPDGLLGAARCVYTAKPNTHASSGVILWGMRKSLRITNAQLPGSRP